MLSFKEIKELIDLVAEKHLSGIEIERAGFRLRIEGPRPSNGAGLPSPMYFSSLPSPLAAALPEHGSPVHVLPPQEAARAGGAAAVVREEAKAEEKLHTIVSPIVGTFYRSASPESAPFVSPGDRVEKGKILCIIEAMKLMNEIESDVSGEIVEVFPRNGQPVEYGEKLFALRLA